MRLCGVGGVSRWERKGVDVWMWLSVRFVGVMDILTYNQSELEGMDKQNDFGAAVVFYRLEDANVFLRFVRVLRDRGVNVVARVEQIQVRFDGDGEKNVYRVDFGLLTQVVHKKALKEEKPVLNAQ